MSNQIFLVKSQKYTYFDVRPLSAFFLDVFVELCCIIKKKSFTFIKNVKLQLNYKTAMKVHQTKVCIFKNGSGGGKKQKKTFRCSAQCRGFQE